MLKASSYSESSLRCSRWLALLLLFVLALGGCSKSSNKDAAAEQTAPTSPGNVHLVRLAPSSAPPFLVAFDDEEHAVVFFATKDSYGNPVTVTGLALVYDDTYLRIERDTRGRPKLIATPDERLMFGRYEDGAVRIDRLPRDGSPTSMILRYSDPQLAAMTVHLPSLDFVEKALDGSFFAQLYDFAKPYVDSLRSAKACGEALGEGLLEDLQGGLKSRSGVLGAALGCAKELLPRPAAEKLKLVLDALLQAAVTGASTVACAASIATTPTGVGIPLALYECGMAIYDAFMLGQKIGEAINAFIGDNPYDPRDFSDADFFLLVDGPVTAKTTAPIKITLLGGGDASFRTAVADLSEIGGPSAAELQEVQGEWTWSGSVTPPVEGGFQLRLSVDAGDFFPAGGGYVSSPSPISVEVSASATVVQLGESVTLTAIVHGGRPPYERSWAINDSVGHDNEDVITDAPQARSHYVFAVRDVSRSLPYFMTSEAWVAVCGDGECSPEEDVTSCEVDCADDNAAGGSGGATGNGNGNDNGGGTASSNSGGMDGALGGGEGGADSNAAGGSMNGGTSATTAPNTQFAGITNGDPHLHTFDGLLFDLQAVGELTLVQDPTDGMEVQVRTHPYGGSNSIAINQAVAARVGTHRVAFYIDGTATLDGVPTSFTPQGTALVGGGKIYRPSAARLLVRWADGSELHVLANGLFLRVDVYPSEARRGEMLGLLGNFDGSQDDELLTRTGDVVPNPADFETFYNVFAESWRIAQADSLFDYDTGQTTETFTDRSFPRRLLRLADLEATAVAEAKQVCEDRGVTEPGWLDACTLDLAATGDVTFAEQYADLPVSHAALEVKPPLVPDADNGGALGSNRVATGTLAKGEQQFYSFTALTGEGVQVRVADLSGGPFVPSVKVYDAEGKLIASTYSGEVAYTSFAAPTSGVFTIVVSDQGTAATAKYALYFTKAPGVSEGGALTSGGVLRGTLDKGDLDSYELVANTGEGIQLRVADIGGAYFVPAMAVYDPRGKLVVTTYSQDVAYTSFSATSSGTYTVVVYDWSSGAASTGDYDLFFTRAPGANEGGALVNGGVSDGSIELGDLDSYTFMADTGEGIQLRVADLGHTSFVPAMAVYDPQGKSVVTTYSQDVAYTSFSATSSGTYTVVVYDWSSGAASTGDYKLYFTRAPGANANGALANGGMNDGEIALGELDSYTFAANAGEGIQLRIADIVGGSFVPAMAVYDPQGKPVVTTYSQDVAYTSFSTTSSGTYTVVVYDWSSGAASTGAYKLYFSKAPGADKGGALMPGVPVSGTIDKGELDSYTLSATTGQTVQLTMSDTGAGAFVPAMAVYGPTGALLKSGYAADAITLSLVASSAGTYTVIAYDWSSGADATGNYDIAFSFK